MPQGPDSCQRLAQRLQPRLKMLPVRQPGAENRLPHLFRARRIDGSIGAIKLQAPGLDIQPAEAQQA